MPLKLTRLWLNDFRSYTTLELNPDDGVTIIVGPNAVGKTNIIEAVQLLTSTTSFRNPQWADCVRWGASGASLGLEASGDERATEIGLAISSTGRRTYTVNGNVRRKLSDVTGILPAVVFSPDDLRMVKDSAERRRAAIDGVGDQLSTTYMALRGEYDRTIRQRNALLKETSVDEGVMAALEARLVEKGTSFLAHRRRLFERLSEGVREAHASLAPGEEVRPKYETSWKRWGIEEDDSSAFTEALRLSREEERARRVTLVGPHRDEIRFLLDGRDARTYASQGQQRTIALAWKLAEVSVITKVGGQPPVLLLDDVMSELDELRRHALASFVSGTTQTIVTTTNLGYFDSDVVNRAHVVELR